MQKKEKINKLIIVVGLCLIMGSTLFSFKFIYNKFKDKQDTEVTIDNLFPEEKIKRLEETNSQEEPEKDYQKKDIYLTNKFLGYIELSNYGIRRLITTGTDKKTLDKGYVGTLSTSINLDDNYGNIILAGHNTSNVFQKLHYMKTNDEIKITTHKKVYYYRIIEKHTINDNDMSYFKQITNKKILTLITCKNNGSQRLIVIAELKEE